ncbi:hypothetical protein BCT60_12500 [Vibrio breoganii]|nr:hypothetical protein BCU74_03020 [Vibrio breoganii]PMM13401.1 hypothetical protein BCT60_12500 [Vibrio breoganii]
MINGLFVHDHIFLKFNGKYYSNGKLTYNQLKYYLNYCDALTVVGRFREVGYDPGDALKAGGENITILGMAGILSLSGLIDHFKIKKNLRFLIEKSDFVISRVPSEYGLMASQICRKTRVPNLVEMVASPFDCLWYRGDIFAKCYAPVLRLRTRYELKLSDFVIYVTKKYLQKHYPTQGAQIGVSDAVVRVESTSKKLTDNKNVKIGVIGNPALKLKGIDVLYSAVTTTRRNYPNANIELHIIGGGLDSDIEIKLSNESFVIQHGFIGCKNKLYEVLDSLDIYVQPSFTEGLPRSVIEAMSRGVPSLGSDVGGIPEIVNSRLLFPAGDSKKLAVMLSNLITQHEFYTEMSEYSIRKALSFNDDAQNMKNNFIRNFSQQN